MNEITINGEVYVKKSEANNNFPEYTNREYVIVRTYSAGVHAGYLESKDDKEVTLRCTRRLWYWDGAATLSQLAGEGTSKPENCKFPAAIDKITIHWIEIIPCTEKAKNIIEGVQVWKA